MPERRVVYAVPPRQLCQTQTVASNSQGEDDVDLQPDQEEDTLLVAAQDAFFVGDMEQAIEKCRRCVHESGGISAADRLLAPTDRLRRSLFASANVILQGHCAFTRRFRGIFAYVFELTQA